MRLKVGLLGGGSWGTTVAAVVSRNAPITLWARDAETVEGINRDNENRKYLPGIALPPAIEALPADGLLLEGGWNWPCGRSMAMCRSASWNWPRPAVMRRISPGYFPASWTIWTPGSGSNWRASPHPGVSRWRSVSVIWMPPPKSTAPASPPVSTA